VLLQLTPSPLTAIRTQDERTLSWLQRHAPAKLRGWRARDKQTEEGAALFPPSCTVPDRVVASRGRGATEQLLVKWRGLGYAACTWEAVSGLPDEDAAAVARFRERARPAHGRRAAAPPGTRARRVKGVVPFWRPAAESRLSRRAPVRADEEAKFVER